MKTFSIKTTVEISLDQVATLLCSAFEGGSNYWYMITEFGKPAKKKDLFYMNGDKPGDHVYRHIQYPLSVGGYLIIESKTDDEESENPQKLDLDSIAKGLAVMAEKYPRHFADIVNDRGDANTGDLFLQCCLFGEEIFA